MVRKAVNQDFFKNWSRSMAYVLGYFMADGSMYINRRGACFIDFTSVDVDRELIEEVRLLLRSEHAVGIYKSANINWNKRYRIEIGSKEIFNDLIKLGITPGKAKNIRLPEIPKKYLSDFVRGYFDGDGCISCGVYSRKDRHSKACVTSCRFTSGSKEFLNDLLKSLRGLTVVKGGFIVVKVQAFELSFSTNDTKALKLVGT